MASPSGTTAPRTPTPTICLAGQGYFDAAQELLREGDQIIANVPRAGRMVVVNLMVTAADAEGPVAVEPINSGGFMPAPRRAAA